MLINLPLTIAVIQGNHSIGIGSAQGVIKHTIPGGGKVGHKASGGVHRIAAEQDRHDAAVVCGGLVQVIEVTTVFQSVQTQGVELRIVQIAIAQFTPTVEKQAVGQQNRSPEPAGNCIIGQQHSGQKCK